MNTIDANALVNYLSRDEIDKDLKNKIKKFFIRSNSGDIKIRIFVYSLGEVFKWLQKKEMGI
ncbi:hypothetical protein [Thermoplasma acidophilum]|uniref:hypothetical protein n=1 Tax=Thermoplasma acidophilum TaxID=2303 RepID=UPI00064E4817|nr:hypothetical protein [Thermoplasma acidophilum]